MIKFKIGDRVCLKSIDSCDADKGLSEGILGTIVSLTDSAKMDKYYVVVDFDNYPVVNYVVYKKQLELVQS